MNGPRFPPRFFDISALAAASMIEAGSVGGADPPVAPPNIDMVVLELVVVFVIYGYGAWSRTIAEDEQRKRREGRVVKILASRRSYI